jgi:hypothetical protein
LTHSATNTTQLLTVKRTLKIKPIIIIITTTTTVVVVVIIIIILGEQLMYEEWGFLTG